MLFIILGCGDTQQNSSKDINNDANEEAAEILEPLTPPDSEEGFQFSFSTTVEPYTEIWKCAVYPAPYEGLSPVNWIEYQVTEGLHHMTIATPSLVTSMLEPGVYDCQTLLEDLMGPDSNYTMAFGLGAGDPTGTMHLPEGVAAQLPPGIDIIHEIHYVNTTDTVKDVSAYVNAYTIDIDDVESGLWGGQIRDETIFVPAGGTATEWSRCVMNRDVEVLFLASHTHELGRKFTIKHFDGTETGETIFENTNWHDPKITQYDPPMVIPAGTGFEWSCEFSNPNDHDVTYGSGAYDEMCNMTIVHTPQDFSAWCDVVETSDGVLWTP